MSDHPKEVERNLKRIYICDDSYIDVFHWFAPAKVGFKLALVSNKFDALVDIHLKSRKWTIGKLRIWSKDIDKKNDDGTTTKTLPFPHKPLPNTIVGFARVNIYSTNSDAMAFLKYIGLLFESDVCLDLNIDKMSNWNIFAMSVWPLLNMSAIIKIHFAFSSDLQNFRRLISPSILCDCSNLRMITCDYNNVLQFPPNDSNESSDGQALCKWLLTPRADGQPKVLKYFLRIDFFPMDALQTSFLNATSSVSFVIRLYSKTSIGPVALVNSLTRELLTSQKIDEADHWWLIERSPTEKSGQKWTEWERNTLLEYGTNDWKLLAIHLI